MSRIACLHIPQLQTAVQPQYRNLITSLIGCSPKVKALETGEIILDASGLVLRGGESTFCHQVLKTCSKNGFTEAYIGIADSAFTAQVASCASNRRINIITQGQDAQFLAPLSIKYLPLADDIEDTLITLGITTMGKLAALPVDSLNERFCKAGEIIWKPWELAQGIDNCQPTLPKTEEIYECFLDLGGAVNEFHEIAFALKLMLDKLTADLKESGLQAQELVLSLYHENNKFDERVLELVRPNRETKFLLEVIRLSLAAKSISRELTAIKLSVSRYTREQWKQVKLPLEAGGLHPPLRVERDPGFRRGRCNRPADMENTGSNHGASACTTQASPLRDAEVLLLQRFTARLGKNKIFTAQAADQYVSENAGVWLPVGVDCIDPINKRADAISPSILPDTNYIKSKVHQPAMVDLVLRQNIPPSPVLVELKDARPDAINYKRRWYKVKSITQPEYLSCQWWNKAIAKYYYKILVADNQQSLLMLLVYDKLKNSWHVEGLYD